MTSSIKLQITFLFRLFGHRGATSFLNANALESKVIFFLEISVSLSWGTLRILKITKKNVNFHAKMNKRKELEKGRVRLPIANSSMPNFHWSVFSMDQLISLSPKRLNRSRNIFFCDPNKVWWRLSSLSQKLGLSIKFSSRMPIF